MTRLGWLVLVAVGAGACADPQGVADGLAGGGGSRLAASDVSTGAIQIAARAELRAADLAHSAATATGSAGFLGYLTDDASFLLPRSPLVQGKAAAAALLAAPPFPFAAGMSMSWTPVFADVSVDGKVGYSFGNVSITGGAVPDVLLGQYIAFWRRQGDGHWAVEAWSFSGAGAEPGELPPFFGHPLDNGAGNFTPVDQAAESQVLMGVDAAFAQASLDLGSAEAFRLYADPHAIVGAGGDPDYIIGRKAIFEYRQGVPPDYVLSWTPLLAGVGPLGDLGYTIGGFAASTGGRTNYGKYLTIWQKSPNGIWKFVQDGGSSSPAPAP
jgi:ketosteroid isomerase-like protein